MASHIIRDFRFDSASDSRIGRTIAYCKGFSRYRSTVFPLAPEGAGFASGEHATPRKDPFTGRIRRHFPRQTSAVIKICFALHAPYPAGMGKAATFRSISANSRRVRWLSANSNQ